MASVQTARTTTGEQRWVVRWRVEGKPKERWFAHAKEAHVFRRQVEAAELQGTFVDPARGAVPFEDYASQWLVSRTKADGSPLAPRTRELYQSLLDLHIVPELGRAKLSAINPERVRTWCLKVAGEASPLQAAKSYWLLRNILGTAVEDGRLPSNPCRLRGAGAERSEERPFVDADMVVALARAIEPRYRALVLLAGFGGLRLGELVALKARDFDPERGVVRVEKQAVELRDGTRIVTNPKTEAGRRVVHLPTAVSGALAWHIEKFPPKDAGSVVFTGPLSDGLRRATLQKAWDQARRATGLAEVHLHDLRHAAGTLAAQTGATTREVMARLGHASPAAAQRYQHAAERRDAVIASALDIVLEALPRVTEDPSTGVHDCTVSSLDDTSLVPRGWRGVGPAPDLPQDLPTLLE